MTPPPLPEVEVHAPRWLVLLAVGLGFGFAAASVLAIVSTLLFVSSASHLADAEAAQRTCEMQAARIDGQLEQYDRWLKLTREGKRSVVGGVNAGGIGGGP